jgi:hypothetical protein
MKNYKLITEEFIREREEFLDKYIVKPDFTSCWIWFGQRDKYGYGIINSLDGHFFVHRIMYKRYKKDLPDDLIIRHKCDNSNCCNPDHLIPGTQAQNMQDAAQRGRTARGSRSNMARLNEEQVQEIKDRYKSYRGVFADFAREYKVHDETIRYIITGKNWAHIKSSNPNLPENIS